MKHAPNFRDLTGQTFGRLTAIRRVKTGTRAAVWRWRCACGNRKNIQGSSVTSGNTRSCGCLHSESARRIGKSRRTHCQTIGRHPTAEYAAFLDAKKRCTNPKATGYENYGARGIRFKFRSFEEFLAALGPRPSSKHELDRIDVNGNYELTNCRWSTRSIQVHNQRKRPGCTSRYKGVHRTQDRKWIARITFNGNLIYLGLFKREIDAARSFDEMARKQFGSSASPNFPNEYTENELRRAA